MAGSDTRYIDPMFYLPEGMDGWEYQETPDEVFEEVEDEGFDDGFDVESDVLVIDESDTEGGDDFLLSVDNLVIVSQTLRRAADGTQVVDIVVEVDDVPGAINYEFGVTKV